MLGLITRAEARQAWLLVRSRLSDALIFRFKLTHDRNLTRHNIDVRDFEAPIGADFEGTDTRSALSSIWRLGTVASMAGFYRIRVLSRSRLPITHRPPSTVESAANQLGAG